MKKGSSFDKTEGIEILLYIFILKLDIPPLTALKFF